MNKQFKCKAWFKRGIWNKLIQYDTLYLKIKKNLQSINLTHITEKDFGKLPYKTEKIILYTVYNIYILGALYDHSD